MTDKPKRTYSKTGKSKAAAWAASEAERKKPTGRPIEVTAEVLAEVCRRIAGGRTLEDVCRDADMPHATTVRDKAADDASFSLDLARARKKWADSQADKLIEIADDSSNDWMEHSFAGKTTLKPDREAIDRSKVRIDVRRYLMSCFNKHIYSEDARKILPNEVDAAESIKSDATVIAPDEAGPKKPVL